MLTWLDRTIGYLSPHRGLARAQARVALRVLASYEGAARGRITEDWLTADASGDAEVGNFHRTLRARARDLVRNNPHAAKGLASLVANKVGTGILCSPDGPNQRSNKRLGERWKRFVDRCDLGGRLDFYGIQALVERTRSEAGEALVRFVPVEVEDTQDVPFRLQVIEPDYLDSDKNETLSERHEIRYGVEIQNGRRIRYWLHRTHPGDTASVPFGRNVYQSEPVPAREILHVAKPLRAGQMRGVSDFAAVILRLRALDDYDAAEVMRKKIAACLAAFVTTPGGLPGASLVPTSVDGTTGERRERFEPGLIGYLKPGESVLFSDPKPSGDYEAFSKVQLRSIAAGLLLPYELLSGDLSEVNYTSLRMGLVQFRNLVEADQWQVLVPQLCEPVASRFAFEALRMEGFPERSVPWLYTPPRFGLLDPGKEIPALELALRSGIDSYPNAMRREGYEWREKLDEIELFQNEVAARGLSLTTVPPAAAEPAPAAAPEAEDQEEAA